MQATERFDNPEQDDFTRQDRAALPRTWARGPWIYLHGSMGWECVCTGPNPDDLDSWEWIPILGRIEGIDGANGVTFDEKRRVFQFAAAINGHASRRNGAQFAIEPSDSRLGKWRHYNTFHIRCEGGRKRYVEPGERLSRLPNGAVVNRPNLAEYTAFRQHLKAAGLVSPMEAEVYEAHIVPLSAARLARAQKDGNADKIAAAKLTIAREAAAWAREMSQRIEEAGSNELEVEVSRDPVADTGEADAATPRARKVR